MRDQLGRGCELLNLTSAVWEAIASDNQFQIVCVPRFINLGASLHGRTHSPSKVSEREQSYHFSEDICQQGIIKNSWPG